MSESNWNSFKIVAERHHNCQLSIVNCQFGEAVKFQFIGLLSEVQRNPCSGGIFHEFSMVFC